MPHFPVSIQLYSVRDSFSADPVATCERLAALGFNAVEPFDIDTTIEAVEAGIAHSGMSSPTAHGSLLGKDHRPAFSAAIRAGVTVLIEPYVSAARWTTREDVMGLAAEFTSLAALAADHGLTLGYHNHWWELETLISGTPALHVFADHLGDDIVLELDTYWCAVGGVDPVALLGRLGERVVALHIKDGPVNHEIEQQVPAGQGRMPIVEVLAAAPHARPVIEFDAYGGDPFEGINESLGYLRSLGVNA